MSSSGLNRREGNRFLLVTAFFSGMTIMALEMSASRLIAPYFGTSLFVWTNIIGVTMISLSLGYYYGGKAADSHPTGSLLYTIILGTGVFTALIPFVAPSVLGLSMKAIREGNAGIFYGSLLGTVLLFAPPLSALGGVAPYTIRLLAGGTEVSGQTAGKIFAVSTVGSILGTFLPVLVFIPLAGTKRTILIFSTLLILLGLYGLGNRRRSTLAVLLLLLTLFTGPAKPGAGIIYEKESPHNYIQVIEEGGTRYLKLNEGYAYHSIYRPGSITVGGVWDYFNVLPLMNPDAREALIIGLAGGTIAREYRYFFPDLMVDGVEIDGEIIEAGREFFDMAGPNLKAIPMDGRTYLSSTDKTYDIVIIDAYKQPYIPFHLTTKEFFSEVKNHLEMDAVIAINAASVRSDAEIITVLENTMASVFSYVYVFSPPGSLNNIIIASDRELSFPIEGAPPGLEQIAEKASKDMNQVSFDESLLVLTDDRAPVEMYTDLMIFNYIRKGDTRRYTQLFD